MDSVLFKEWVRDLNKKFQTEGRKVALIIHNCPAHLIIENLSHVNFFCFFCHRILHSRESGGVTRKRTKPGAKKHES